MYDEDYLRLFAVPFAEDPRSDADAELIWGLAGPRPGTRVLDLACGHGRIANRLAARGCEVTGLDSSAVFLERARADAEELGVEVDYVAGDLRELPWTDRFDLVVNWATAFGYFDDDVNRDVLRQVRRALRPGGQLVMDLNNLVARLRGYQPSHVEAHGSGDLRVDRFHLEPLTNRLEVERTIVRDGSARTLSFVVRLFGFPEIRDWLLAAGFTAVAGHGEDGAPLAAEHDRMVLHART
nr:methyltransferase [uncultured bacterium]